MTMLFCATPVFVAATARAEPDMSAAALALVEAGRELMVENKVDEACPKFREAARIAPPGLAALKQLAECYEKAGRPAAAQSVWREVAAGALRTGQSDRAEDARGHAASLAASLSMLTVDVSPAARNLSGLEVRCDGATMGAPQWGLAVPVDPGGHTVLATAPGHRSWRASFDLVGAGGVTVTVPLLEAEPPALKTAVALAPVDTGRGRRAAGLLVAGAGATTLGAALAFQVLALNELGACQDIANCTGTDAGRYQAGRREQFAVDALYVLGGAAIAGGLLLYVTAPTPAVSAHEGVRVSVDVASRTLRLGAAW